MLNRLQIIGNLGHTPEVKEVNGSKVANIQIGVTERGYTTKDGKKVEDRTDWFTVVAWRGLAEVIEKYVNKGDRLYIEGKMHSRQYEGKDGIKRTTWELWAENIIMLGGKKQEGQHEQPAPQQYEDDDPIPF